MYTTAEGGHNGLPDLNNDLERLPTAHQPTLDSYVSNLDVQDVGAVSKHVFSTSSEGVVRPPMVGHLSNPGGSGTTAGSIRRCDDTKGR